MNKEIEEKMGEAILVGKLLFDRGEATGSSGNISFLHNGKIYISASGVCLGFLVKEDFAVLEVDGTQIKGKVASKEWPLHTAMYQTKGEIGAVIHTHSFYATLFSCISQETEDDMMPMYTPYLSMRVGKIGVIPFAPPGSEELFRIFHQRVTSNDGFLLQNHGLILGGRDILDAFYNVEELEASAKIACFAKGCLEIEGIHRP